MKVAEYIYTKVFGDPVEYPDSAAINARKATLESSLARARALVESITAEEGDPSDDEHFATIAQATADKDYSNVLPIADAAAADVGAQIVASDGAFVARPKWKAKSISANSTVAVASAGEGDYCDDLLEAEGNADDEDGAATSDGDADDVNAATLTDMGLLPRRAAPKSCKRSRKLAPAMAVAEPLANEGAKKARIVDRIAAARLTQLIANAVAVSHRARQAKLAQLAAAGGERATVVSVDNEEPRPNAPSGSRSSWQAACNSPARIVCIERVCH